MQDKNQFLLSVIIVARNEENNIARCIESIIKNTSDCSPVEILLSDSASTDHTVAIASRYPVNIISLKPDWPRCPSAGRFCGVNNVTGEYILVIDGDMELLEGWVGPALEFMRSNPNVASVVGIHYDVWQTPGGNYTTIFCESDLGDQVRKIQYVFGSSIFRRAHLNAAGNFQPFLRAEEEAEVSHRLTIQGFELFYLPLATTNHFCIPVNTFAETARRLKKNLWSGMGDMFSWCLYNRYFAICWIRFRIYFLFSLVTALFILFLTIGIITCRSSLVLAGLALPVMVLTYMCCKKHSVFQGILSTVNMACITWAIWGGLTRRIPPIDNYPLDIIWIKRR